MGSAECCRLLLHAGETGQIHLVRDDRLVGNIIERCYFVVYANCCDPDQRMLCTEKLYQQHLMLGGIHHRFSAPSSHTNTWSRFGCLSLLPQIFYQAVIFISNSKNTRVSYTQKTFVSPAKCWRLRRPAYLSIGIIYNFKHFLHFLSFLRNRLSYSCALRKIHYLSSAFVR